MAIIGVPNRRDPFLRPLLVALLYRVGLNGYGYEKPYSRRALLHNPACHPQFHPAGQHPAKWTIGLELLRRLSPAESG